MNTFSREPEASAPAADTADTAERVATVCCDLAAVTDLPRYLYAQEDPAVGDVPITVITVRLDREHHVALHRQAKQLGVSLNKLCRLRLLAPISHVDVPLVWLANGRVIDPALVVVSDP